LETLIITINYYYVKNYCYCGIITERGRDESILRKPVSSVNNFSPRLVCIKMYSLATLLDIKYDLQFIRLQIYIYIWSRVSSGSIVSDYGLDDRAIGVRSPAGAKDFSSILCVQTGSGAHPASCTMGSGGPFPGGKARPGRDADHSPPSSAEAVNE
jgi:hypothetical protein